MRADRMPGFLVVALVAGGCSGGGGGGGSRADRLAHTWELESGDMFAPFAPSAGEVRWLNLEDDGTGEILTRRPLSGATGCTAVFFQVLDGDIVQVEIPALSAASDFAFGKGSTSSSFLATWEISGGTLTLTDANGFTAVFAKRSESDIQDSDRCEDAALTEIPLPIPPIDEDPVFGVDGTNLWYLTAIGSGAVYMPFDPATATTGASVTIDLPDLFAWQGTDAWAGYASGHNNRVARLTPPAFSEFSIADEVDTLNDLGSEVVMGNAVLDSANHLWIAGRSLDYERAHILTVDTAPEPDEIVADLDLESQVEAIAFRGTELWAIGFTAGPMLVRIDPATGDIVRNLKLPDARWDYVAGAGGQLYLHQFDYQDGQHTLVRADIP